MAGVLDLQTFLDDWAVADARRADIAATIMAICSACREIGALAARGSLAGLPASTSTANGQGNGVAERPTVFDLIANDFIVRALRTCPVAAVASEVLRDPWVINRDSPLLVAVDPMDGSTTIDTNTTMGTVFSVLPAPANLDPDNPASAFLQAGEDQLAAGFIVYGPQTALVLSLGNGTHIFTLDPPRGTFCLTDRAVEINPHTRVFAVNASNYMHWDDAIRTYVDDCMRGTHGPRQVAFNMRWSGSLVTEIFRIFMHGGIYMYPADKRPGFERGQIRLIYEANPIAFIVEQARGKASTGRRSVLSIEPRKLDQKTPVIIGSHTEVDYVVRIYGQPEAYGERSPLFGRRGLFRL